MAETKKPLSNKSGTFDIVHPSKVPPASATSRQIIIKHQPVADPMVTDATASPAKDETADAPLKPAKKVILKPLHDDVPVATATHENNQSTPTPVPAAEPEPVAEPAPAEPAAETEPKPEPETKPAVEAKPESKPDAKAQPKDASKKDPTDDTPAESDQEAIERQVKLQKMIDSQEFFLPIQTTEQRRNRVVAVIGILVIILLAVAWYDVALDAGLMPNSYNLPHTRLLQIK